MPESTDLSKALERHYSNPRPAAFTNFVVVTAGLTPAQAANVPAPRFNSVWGIVNHIWFWQEALLRLLRDGLYQPGDLGAPDESGWPPAGSPTDEGAWGAAIDRALTVNAELAKWVAGLTDQELAQPTPAWGSSKAQAILSIIAHNSYHTCEIISVRHMQGLWLERT